MPKIISIPAIDTEKMPAQRRPRTYPSHGLIAIVLMLLDDSTEYATVTSLYDPISAVNKILAMATAAECRPFNMLILCNVLILCNAQYL